MRRPVRSSVSFLVAVLVLAACGEQSRVDPDARVQIHGSVRDADGAPLDGRPVRLGSGVSDLEGGLGVLTVGMFCLSGGCTGDFFDTTTGDDGRYRFELTGEETQSSFGEAVSFLVSTAGEPTGSHPTGPVVAARFRVQVADLALPELQLVDPGLELGAVGSEVQARWDTASAPGPYAVDFGTGEDALAWRATTASGEVRLDGRLLEDLRGRVTVGGEAIDRAEGSDVTIHWRSSSLAYHGGFGAPPSRGADCVVLASDGTQEPVPGACGLTDGDMTSAGVPGVVCPPGTSAPGGGCPGADRVRVHLQAPVPADLVVVRGCSETCPVWVTPQGAGAPVHVGTVSGSFGALTLDGVPLSSVEVEAADRLGDLAEVSVWAPASADVTPLAPVDDPPSIDVVGGGVVPGDGGDGWRWSATALAAAAIALVGGGVLLGRRTSR